MNINDSKYAAINLTNLALNDEYYRWLGDNGGTGFTISDREISMLISQGGTSGTVGDLWFEVLGVAGYTGDLSQRMYNFWRDGGILTQGIEWVVGNDGASLFGYQPVWHPTASFGSATPLKLYGMDIRALTANSSTDICVIGFGDSANPNDQLQVGARTTISLAFEGYQSEAPQEFTWNGARYTRTDVALSAFIQAADGTTLEVFPQTVISVQPQDITVADDALATFSVSAYYPLNYQWSREGATIPGATNRTLEFIADVVDDQSTWDVLASNAVGSDVSTTVTLTVLAELPVIDTQPFDVTTVEGVAFVMEVRATGASAYQWETDQGIGAWIDVVGATFEDLSQIAVLAETGWKYRANVFNIDGAFVTSDFAESTVTSSAVAPIIEFEPQDTVVIENNQLAFSVSSANATTAQWATDQGTGTWIDVPGQVTFDFSQTAILAESGWRYRVLLGNASAFTTLSREALSTVDAVVIAPRAQSFRLDYIGAVTNNVNPLTSGRASAATIEDYQGNILDVIANEIRYAGARRIDRGNQTVYNAGVPGIEYVATESDGITTIQPEPYLLHEPAVTNLITDSNKFNGATWDDVSTTRIVLAVDEWSGMDKVEVTAINAGWNRLVSQASTPAVPGDTLEFTLYYAGGTSGQLRVDLRANNAGASASLDGPVGALTVFETNGGVPTLESDVIVNAALGIRRLRMSVVTNQTDNYFAAAGPSSNTGGGTVFLYGSMLTKNAGQFTSHVVTDASLVTRDIDSTTMLYSEGQQFLNTAGIALYRGPALSDATFNILNAYLRLDPGSVFLGHNAKGGVGAEEIASSDDGSTTGVFVQSWTKGTDVLVALIWDSVSSTRSLNVSVDGGVTWGTWVDFAYDGAFDIGPVLEFFGGSLISMGLQAISLHANLENNTVPDSKTWAEANAALFTDYPVVSGGGGSLIIPAAQAALSVGVDVTRMRAIFAQYPVTNTVQASGNWSSIATWSAGRLPITGDNLRVPAGMQLTVDAVYSAQVNSMLVDVGGVLIFHETINNGITIDTLFVEDGGRFIIGDAVNQATSQVEIIIPDTTPIDRAIDPDNIGRGIIVHGNAHIYGEYKTPFTETVNPPMMGDTVIELSKLPNFWRPGDEVVIPSALFDVDIEKGITRDEIRFIGTISGTTVTLTAPLSYDHLDDTEPNAPTFIMNLTRNIKFRGSTGANPAQLGHFMIMHNPYSVVKGLQTDGLGRTNKALLLDDFLLDSVGRRIKLPGGGGWEPGPTNNPRARYGIHLHHCGADLSIAPVEVGFCAVMRNFGWGLVIHNSHGYLHDNASFDIFGSHYVSEDGTETGSFVDNIACYAKGTGSGIKTRKFNHDMGHSGVGFWIESRNFRIDRNVAISVNKLAFSHFHRHETKDTGVSLYTLVTNLMTPNREIAKGSNKIFFAHVPIFSFDDNIAINSDKGFEVVKANRDQRHNVGTLIRRFKSYQCKNHMDVQYTQHYSMIDCEGTALKNAKSGHWGIMSNTNTRTIGILRGFINGYVHPVLDQRTFQGGDDTSDLAFSEFMVDGAPFDITVDLHNKDFLPATVSGYDPLFHIDTPLANRVLGRLTYAYDVGQSYDLPAALNSSTEFLLLGDTTDESGTYPYLSRWRGNENLDPLIRAGYYERGDLSRYILISDYIHDRLTGKLVLVTTEANFTGNYGGILGPKLN